jgi:hypothetical protein
MFLVTEVVRPVDERLTATTPAAHQYGVALKPIAFWRIASWLPAAQERRHSPTVVTALEQLCRTSDVLENLIEGVAA